MNFTSLSKFLLMLIVVMVHGAGLADSLPAQQRRTTDTYGREVSQRFRRKVGNLNITSTPQEYIRNLYEEYTHENGKPRLGIDRPTDVWVFPDKDIAKESFREKPIRNTKCATYTQYIFQWSSVLDELLEKPLSVRSSILRAYIQIINRHVEENEHVNVTLTVMMVPRNSVTNGTINSSDWSEGVLAGQQVVTVSRGSDGWAEINVTEGAERIWPLIHNNTEVQVVIKAEVNCSEQKKVPFNFINPAEISLERQNRRDRHLDIQPFLVIFTDNEETLTLLQEQSVIGEDDENRENNIPRNVLFPDLSKRSVSSYTECSISNYVVDLHALDLNQVVFPRHVNISKCSGSCSHPNTIDRLGSNHAKIMGGAHIRRISGATRPCCVPTKYETVSLLMQSIDRTADAIISYNHFIATQCGCR